jgi:conjugal transfer pilus assembly protein TraW
MVNAVFSSQCSVIRGFTETSEVLRSHGVILKQIFFLFFFLNTEYWALSTASASDLETHGTIYSIDEQDPIQLIQQKLKVWQENGELERHHLALQKKTKAAIQRPKPVEGITKATETRVFYYDPTYGVPEDLKDHTGKIFYQKDTKINPLETVSLSSSLLFFDGDDLGQKAWALQKSKEGPLKLILIKGAPLALSEEWKIPVYFDQGGILTKKLGIQHTPALVTQEGLHLRIEEIKWGEKE